MIAEIYSRAQQEMLVADCANYGVLGTIAPFWHSISFNINKQSTAL